LNEIHFYDRNCRGALNNGGNIFLQHKTGVDEMDRADRCVEYSWSAWKNGLLPLALERAAKQVKTFRVYSWFYKSLYAFNR